MRSLFPAVMALLLAVTAVEGQPVYVNDVVQVTLRAGPGYDHKVLAVLRSGDLVQIVEERADWYRVRTDQGGEGWLLARLLTEKPPNVLKFRRLEQELEALRGRGGPSGEEIAALLEEKLHLQNALTELRFELDAERQARQALERETSDEGHIRQSLAAAGKRLADQAGELEECRRLAAEAAGTRDLYWFATGAGILLTGLLIGLLMGRRRRKVLY